jgi:hypothetical protein
MANIIYAGNSTGLYGVSTTLTPLSTPYGNANVLGLLVSGQVNNIDTGNITVTANVTSNNIIANTYYWGNGVPITQGAYSNLNVQNYLPIYSGDLGGVLTTGTQPNIRAVGSLANLTIDGNMNAQFNHINNLSNPIQASDAATKDYVDSITDSLNVHASVFVATSAPLPPFVVANGPDPLNPGVGATLTSFANQLLNIDGRTVIPGQRVLIKNETSTNSPYNGIWTVVRNSIGFTWQLVRASDMDQPPDFYGAYVYVSNGNTHATESWICINQPNFPITVGTTAIAFSLANDSGLYLPGNAVSFDAQYINVNVDGNTIVINANNELRVGNTASFVAPNIGNATGNTITLANTITTTNGNIDALNGNINVANGAIDVGNGNFVVTNNGTLFTTGSITTNSNLNVAGNGVFGNNVSITNSLTIGNRLNANTANIQEANVTVLRATSGNIGNFQFIDNTIFTTTQVMVIDPGPPGSTGNLIIEGNLLVNGTTTTINSNTISTNDKVINVSNNANLAAQANQSGIAVGPVGGEYATWEWFLTPNAWSSSCNIISQTNIEALGSFIGNGNTLANINGANVSTVPTANVVTDNAQPNITSVGTLTSLTLGSALTAANGGTGLISPGDDGNILTSDGTSWISKAGGGGFGPGTGYQNFTGQRASGVTYTNTSDSTIFVIAQIGNQTSGIYVFINGNFMIRHWYDVNGGAGQIGYSTAEFLVAPGDTYLVSNGPVRSWWEFR